MAPDSAAAKVAGGTVNPTIVRRPPGNPALLPTHWPALLRRVYAARGIQSAAELDPALSGLLKPSMRGMTEAVALLEHAILNDNRILIVGDFDADGATSCAVAVRGLRRLGARRVDYLVPNRFEYGYGLTPEIVAVAAEDSPQLLITVDNGIASIDGVAAARAEGMKVIVTDHHLPGTELPAAEAIVNPNQPDCGFPSKNLAGVGVMFYLLLALRAARRARGMATPNLAELLDTVALGTVADLVPLDQNNRILVEQGLRRIRSGQCSAGIRALAAVAGRDLNRLTCADIGFALAPRLNAAGRLQDMSIGIECLLTDDPGHAQRLATVLDELNRTRRAVEADMRQQAEEYVENFADSAGKTPFGICVHRSGWHPGVVGIVAARLKERFHRPAVVFAGDGTELKGSARSIPGLHMRDLLADIASGAPDLITRFGGHAMAAGLTLPASHLERFTTQFDEAVRKRLSAGELERTLVTDGPLAASEFDLETAERLRIAGPWGQAFPEPSFDNEFELVSARPVGEGHLKLRLRLLEDGSVVDAIAFNHDAPENELSPGAKLRVIYRLEVNRYRGISMPQLNVAHLEPVAVSGGAAGGRADTGDGESV